MGVKLADKLEQMNGQNYPLIDASAVEYKKQDGTTIRVDEALNSVESGGSLDLTNYQQKTDDTLNTTDKTIVGAINEIKGNADIIINDDEPTEETIYSSVKIERDFASKIELANMIQDNITNGVRTYSSVKIERDFQQKTDNTLDTTDKTVVGAINEVNGNLLDTVGFSADYKNIILNRKNGLNPYPIPISAIIHNAKLTELNDIDSTDIGNGKTIVYDSATQKHKYVDSTGTDELVKMEASSDAHYLSDLIDKSTVVNDNGVLKVKKLDGQEVTIAEINYLKGLTMNVMDLVNTFSNGGVKIINTPVATYADLLTYDKTSLIDGISYLLYVLADETHDNAKTTYLIDKTSSTPTYFGFAGEHRDFVTNPIDLANEVTGKLDNSHIDADNLWSLLTINDTYKTLTTNNEVFGTHGAKALYDDLTTAIGDKANATDLTSHTSDTDIHVTSVEREAWNNKANANEVLKTTDIKKTVDISLTDKDICSGKAIYEAIEEKKDCIGKETVLYNSIISSEGTFTLTDNVNNYDFIIINHIHSADNRYRSVVLSKTEISKCTSGGNRFFCVNGLGSDSSFTSGYFNKNKVVINVYSGEKITSITGYKFGEVIIQQTITNPAPDQSYSTSEQSTGGTWIDGKIIYRKVYTGLSIGTTVSSWTSIGISLPSNYDKIINATAANITASSYRNNNSIAIALMSGVLKYYTTSKYTVNVPNVLILEYTKK